MIETKSSTTQRTPARGVSHGTKSDQYETNPSGIVVGLTLSMAWQLALVVLVPILLGHVADNKFKISPWLTLIGLGLAVIMMVIVVRRVLQQLNEYTRKDDTV